MNALLIHIKELKEKKIVIEIEKGYNNKSIDTYLRQDETTLNVRHRGGSFRMLV